MYASIARLNTSTFRFDIVREFHSSGGRLALELARRGRARSLVALAPPGERRRHLRETSYEVLILIAANGALARVGAVLVGAIRSLALRREFRVVRFGVVEGLTALEPPALAVVAWLLISRREIEDPSWVEAVAAVLGAATVLAGLALLAWSVWSWRSQFVGHAIREDQALVTAGAYGLVRHPSYLAAMLIWVGLSFAWLNPIAAAITLLYVIPVYLAYARSEERMMLEAFGAAYDRYRSAVPAFVAFRRQRPVDPWPPA